MITKKYPFSILLILFIIFVTPYFLASFFFHHRDFLSPKTTNRGQLIQPIIPIAQLNLKTSSNKPFPISDFQKKWVMLYISPRVCDEDCNRSLYYMRQIQRAMGKNSQNVIRVILTSYHPDPELEQKLQGPFSGTVHVTSTQVKKLALKNGWLYLVDPSGNIMMSYIPNTNPSDVLKDLEHLLKVTNIG